jgi:UDP:flavonoid glycosyltransferase YjiC (YdhE family)
MEYYRDKITDLGLEFAPMAPHLDPTDRELGRRLMDADKGSEAVLRDIIMPNLRSMYDDLMTAVSDADVLVTGEITYAVKSVVEKAGVKWVSTSLQPGTFFSVHDPFLPPMAPWFQHLRFLGPTFYRNFYKLMRWTARDWYTPYKAFRRELGLSEDHDPIFAGKYSDLKHLALFSEVLGAPQPDWPSNTVQVGFCFYDGHAGHETLQPELEAFLNAGGPPIVFTLGSAAVMDPRDFFEQSAGVARKLGRRAVLLYGVFNEPPTGLSDDIVGFDYAPYSQLFPRAACVVHQAGVGTTGQVLRAGVPHLIMPYAHDQPDNAARCRRLGVSETIRRDDYNADRAATVLEKILKAERYRAAAQKAKDVIESETGTEGACDEIESML